MDRYGTPKRLRRRGNLSLRYDLKVTNPATNKNTYVSTGCTTKKDAKEWVQTQERRQATGQDHIENAEPQESITFKAAYTAWRVRPVLVELRRQPARESAITLGGFLRFYTPLAMTSLMMLLMEPIGAAALGRMPQALACLAVWPVLFGLVWMSEALGESYQEVVVALIERPGGYQALRRFARALALTTVMPLVFIAAVPAVASGWFEGVIALPPELARLAHLSLWFALPMPVMAVLRSLFQGVLVHHHETRGIPESVALFLGAAVGLSVAGVMVGSIVGLFVVVPAMSTGMAAQTAWLAVRSRRFRAQMCSGAVSVTM